MIQLVIEIDKDKNDRLDYLDVITLKEIIRNGKPLTKGHWIDSQYDKDFSQCSECGSNWEKLIIENYNMDYCPNCGSYNGGD